MKTKGLILLALALLSAVVAYAQPSTRIDLTQLVGPTDTSKVNFVITEGDTAYYEYQVPSLSFDITTEEGAVPGMLTWNTDESTLDIGLDAEVILQTGQEMVYYVKNQTGSTITNGQVVQFDGTLGASGRLLISLARADTTSEAKYIMGVATEEIANGEDGFVTAFGKVRGIDTDGSTCGETWADGDILYLSATTAGCFTSTEPSAPALKVPVAAVVNAANNGTLFVRPTYYPSIADIHDIDAAGATNGQVLAYNSSTGIWEASSAAGGGTGWLKDSLEAGDVDISAAFLSRLQITNLDTFRIGALYRDYPGVMYTEVDKHYFLIDDNDFLVIEAKDSDRNYPYFGLTENSGIANLNGVLFDTLSYMRLGDTTGVPSSNGYIAKSEVDSTLMYYHNGVWYALAHRGEITGGGTGWLKDSLSVADVDIPMNRNQLSFSSDIPFGLSSDTLISLSTPRSDGTLKAHFLVFNFGALSAGFVEQDQNLRFFNTAPGEGLAYAGDYYNATATSSLKNRQIPDIQTVKRLISDSVGTSVNIYNTSDTITTDRKVIAQDQNTYLDFLGFDYLNVDNDDGNDNIGLRVNGTATAGFENRLFVLSDGKGQDSILFRHEYRGGLGGFGIVSTIDTDFSSPGFTLTSGSNRLNLGTNEYIDGTNSKGLEYAADYSANFTDESLVTKRYVDAQVVGGSAFWEDASGTVRTVSASSGLDFVFGSSQLDDSGNAAEDERIVFDNSKGFFGAGRFQGTQVDNANRGVVAANFGLNNTASGDASVAAGGQNNAATGTGTYVHGENALAPLRNQYAHGAGAGSANSGAAQYMRLMGHRDFTGTGTVKIYMDGSSEHFVIPNNTVWNGTAYCNVVVTTAGGIVGVGDRVFLRAQFSAKNEAGIVDVLPNYDNPGLNDASMGAVGLLLGADNTNDALNVNISSVSGSVSSAVRCACYFDIMQTKF